MAMIAARICFHPLLEVGHHPRLAHHHPGRGTFGRRATEDRPPYSGHGLAHWNGNRASRRNSPPRHLGEDCLVLYDVSSSYYEGHTCPLAQYGHNRDGKKGLPTIVYGVMNDGEGRPIAVEVYPGNTGDSGTTAGLTR